MHKNVKKSDESTEPQVSLRGFSSTVSVWYYYKETNMRNLSSQRVAYQREAPLLTRGRQINLHLANVVTLAEYINALSFNERSHRLFKFRFN